MGIFPRKAPPNIAMRAPAFSADFKAKHSARSLVESGRELPPIPTTNGLCELGSLSGTMSYARRVYGPKCLRARPVLRRLIWRTFPQGIGETQFSRFTVKGAL